MRYDGGKGAMGVAQWIINQIPPHRVYIEPFLGGGAILRLKAPARSSIAIERDPKALSLWTPNNIPDLRVIYGDAISWLEKFKPQGDEFIYCDPPYLLSTLSSAVAVYRYTLNESDHRRLLSILKRLRCSVAISGYWSQMYARGLIGWRATQFSTFKRSNERAEEWLWMNYPEPVALHDYRFLGSGFRERERIKRKKLRWKRRLAAMSVLERRALMATLAECDDVGRKSYRSGISPRIAMAAGIAVKGDSAGGRARRFRRGSPAPIAVRGDVTR
jgi:DNA adenine methylase